MSRDLKLTLPAVEDFEGILEYTLITWSEFQYKKYRDLLFQALAAITADSWSKGRGQASLGSSQSRQRSCATGEPLPFDTEIVKHAYV